MKKNDEQAWKTIGSKLRSYEEPAPAEGWSRLAKELQADEPAPVRRLWGVRPAVRWAVAAVLLGIAVTIGWQWQGAEAPAERLAEEVALEVRQPEPGVESPSGHSLLAVAGQQPSEPSTRVVRRGDNIVLRAAALHSRPAAVEAVAMEEEKEEAMAEAAAEEEKATDAPGAKEPTPARQEVKRVHKSLPYTPAAEKPGRGRGHGWAWGVAGQSLLAGGGGGPRGLLQVTPSDFASQTGFLTLSSTAQGCIQLPSTGKLMFKEGVPYLALEQQSSVSYDHRQPIAFGLTVRKQLGTGFSIESGLTYTLLASDVYESNSTMAVSQKLHYLGVPLRAAWQFYEGRRLRAYVSAGGAAEKCVQARRGGEHLSVHALQWSLTGAVGAELRLTSRLGLYLEPGVAHYFDDGSAVQTIRKEHPTAFSLQTGLRLSY